MVFKRLHLGSVNFTQDTLPDIVTHLNSYYSSDIFAGPSSSSKAGRRGDTQMQTKLVRDAIAAIALCHNVTPVVDGDTITYLLFVFFGITNTTMMRWW
jgi:phospholipid-translocating ATPase